ncbi:hypothetical protein CALCODRAFT_486766 [Calocera cornea HHB12733]|uniref:Uncharacterized protein n=1 Tax=Calocera cornea HHB12733 TaxID=1353952 RepID=A0A165DJJ3_9BASI|nr:hypothetical protein CALCODRAFT_486766 [Calocera cornea HHB12733]
MSMVDTVDNTSLAPTAASSNTGGNSLTPAADWESTISFVGDVQQAAAPFIDFFKAKKTSIASTGKEDASAIEDSASEVAPELDKKGKGPAKAKAKKKTATKKAEKTTLEDAGQASGEKGGAKKMKKGGKALASGEMSGAEAAVFASQLVKAYEAKYGADAVWTQERLKELITGDKISKHVPHLVLAPAAPAPAHAPAHTPAHAPADDLEDASADEDAEDDTVPAAGPVADVAADDDATSTDADVPATDADVPAGEATVPAAWEPANRHRKEKIEALVLSGMDNPGAFNRSPRPQIDVRTATESQMLVEKVRVANVGEFDGIVAALVALEEQEDEIEGAVGRVREKEIAESYQVGRRTGWDKTIAARQKEFEKLPLEERKRELERRKIADAQLELERHERELEERKLAKQGGKKKRGKKLAKVKAASKDFVWTYGGKVLEIGVTVALQAVLKKFGVDEPEKLLSEVFGLGQALQGVDGIVNGGGSTNGNDNGLC